MQYSKRSLAKIGSKNPNWKGGKTIRSLGYLETYYPNHPYSCRNYVLEHRLVMEKHIGRFLNPKEVVHHINGNVKDNRIENLFLFSNHSSHLKNHHKERSK